MREALRLLLGEEVEKLVVMGLAKDGSEVGGAHSKTFLLSCRPFRSLTFCLSVCLPLLYLRVQPRSEHCKRRNTAKL
jgi:hypothetical protein